MLIHECDPIGQTFIGYAIQDLAAQKAGGWTDALELFDRPPHAAAAGSGKWHDRLAREITALQERRDDARRNIPPDWKTDIENIIRRRICQFHGQSRSDGFIRPLFARAARLICPVQISTAVRDGRPDLEKVSLSDARQALCHTLCRSRCRKIGHQYLTHLLFQLQAPFNRKTSDEYRPFNPRSCLLSYRFLIDILCIAECRPSLRPAAVEADLRDDLCHLRFRHAVLLRRLNVIFERAVGDALCNEC